MDKSCEVRNLHWSHFIDHVHVNLRISVKNVTGEILQKLTAFQFNFILLKLKPDVTFIDLSCLVCDDSLQNDS